MIKASNTVLLNLLLPFWQAGSRTGFSRCSFSIARGREGHHCSAPVLGWQEFAAVFGSCGGASAGLHVDAEHAATRAAGNPADEFSSRQSSVVWGDRSGGDGAIDWLVVLVSRDRTPQVGALGFHGAHRAGGDWRHSQLLAPDSSSGAYAGFYRLSEVAAKNSLTRAALWHRFIKAGSDDENAREEKSYAILKRRDSCRTVPCSTSRCSTHPRGRRGYAPETSWCCK
jgi:hypothetical protein